MGRRHSPILAAGAVVIDRPEGKSPRVLLVHRPLYDDWTLPKGKLETDETLPGCAQREVEEETGVHIRLGLPIGKISYSIGSGKKESYYWLGHALSSKRHKPNKEVDKVAWLSAGTALARMTYGDERTLVDRALTLSHTTPLLIVRHAKAMERKNWSGRDQARPLSARGRKQARNLVPLLGAYGVTEVVSSSATRCAQTMKPYSKASGHEIELWSSLTEEQAEANEKGVAQTMQRLVQRVRDTSRPLAVCGHRPVLPLMQESVGVPPRPMQTAAVLVAHLDADGKTVAYERHKQRV
ncbi:NUDIX hydrolase [Nigerium massiliense]|uniref:NUDIX hydrolase n=1 Tax=Nigerium massiliense TaxID=1522317 RepID=UPI000590B1B3|nr:NUDIX hydrolase [Nigerium massiliense]